jgi:DUF2075 family protein
MATYVNNLRLTELATGEGSGTWGTTTNTNLELIGEALGHGSETIANASTHTITVADGTSDSARSFYLICAGGGQACTVTLAPNTLNKVWMIENTTSYTLTFSQGSGANVAVAAGQVKMIATNGAGAGAVVYDLLTDVDLTGTTTAVNVSVSGTLGVTGVLTATSLDISGDIDVDGTSNLDVVDIDGATQIDATVTVGVDDTGYDVKFFGATTGKSLLWDESADSLIVTGTTTLVGTTNLDAVDIDGAVQADGTVTVGVDDTGYDVKFFGATTGKSLLWDESADSLIVTGTTTLVGTTNLDVVDIDGAVQADGTITVGVDDTGYDVKFFGATTGKSLLWDESADSLIVTGTIDATTVEFDNLSGTGAVNVTNILDEDNMASDSATALATQQSIKAYVDAQVGTVDTLSEVLAIGNTTGATDIDVDGAQKVQFRDAAIYINSSVDGQLDIVADTEIQIAATTVDINGTVDVSGTVTATGTSVFASLDISGDIDVDGTTNLDAVDIDGAVNIADNVTMASTNPILDILADAGADAKLILRESGTGIVGAEFIYDGGDNALYLKIGNNTANTALKIARDDGSLSTPTLGTSNVRFGVNAGNSIIAGGNYNVVVGDEAGTALTTGDNNVAVGYNSLASEDTGSANTAIGRYALSALNNDAVSYNTAVGFSAGAAVTTGIENTLIGGQAGDALTTGSYNVALGVSALSGDTLGSRSTAIGRSALQTQNFTSATNAYNVAIGFDAGTAVTTGVENTLIGGLAGDALTDADVNVAIGSAALGADTLGSRSVAVGAYTLDAQNFTSATNTYNTAVGYAAGSDVTTGVNNTLIGGLAGDALTDADHNTAIGSGALTSDTLGSRSTAIGAGALTFQNFTSATATYNTAVGYDAGNAVTTGIQNTLIGGLAGDALTEGFGNVALGYSALSSDTLGKRSVAIGHQTLLNQNFTSVTDVFNTAVGHEAGKSVTTGTANTLIGGLAGDTITTANSNVAVGKSALSATTTGGANTAVGTLALDSNTTAVGNVAVGYDSLGLNTTGASNVAVGTYALDANTTASNNTAVGYNSLGANTAGNNNVAFGASALVADTLGSRNTAIGTGALESQNFTSATNSYNTVVGFEAGSSVTTGVGNTFVGGTCGNGTDDGGNNTAVGYLTLRGNCGNGNAAFGRQALDVCTGGSNTALGTESGKSVTSGSNNIFVGRDSGFTGSPGGNITTESNILSLGDENIATANIQVDWTVASDARDKTDFTALDLGLDFVKALAPVTYKWDKRSKYGDKTAEDYDLNAQTPDGTHKEDWLDIGFKAQEVEALEIAAGYNKDNNTNLVSSHTGDGKQMGLQYSKFVPILVKAIQEQNALIEALTARITTLEGK